ELPACVRLHLHRPPRISLPRDVARLHCIRITRRARSLRTGLLQLCILLLCGRREASLREPHELLEQLRVPQDLHLRKLLTAAHTYSLNWSRITSCSAEPSPQGEAQGLAQPSRAPLRERLPVVFGKRFT